MCLQKNEVKYLKLNHIKPKKTYKKVEKEK